MGEPFEIHLCHNSDEEGSHINSAECWCLPDQVYKDDLNGNEVWVHKSHGEPLAPSEVVARAIAFAIADRDEVGT